MEDAKNVKINGGRLRPVKGGAFFEPTSKRHFKILETRPGFFL